MRIKYKWLVVAMLWLVCVLNYADRQAIFAVFPKLEAEFGFDKVQLGLIASAFMWVYAAGAPLAGFIGDRARRKDLILGGCLFWSAITFITGWCSKFWHFVSVRAAEGFGETFYFPASMSLISDYHDRSTRSRAMSLHQSSVYIGTIVGSWVAALVAEKYNWRLAFYLFGSLGIVVALLLYRFLKEPVREAIATSRDGLVATPTFKEAVGAVFSNPPALLIMGGFVGANFVATIFLAWTPTFLVEKFQFKLSTAGLSGTVFIHLASACAVPFAGMLADKLANRSAGGRILVQVGGLLIGSVFIAIVGSAREKSFLISAMIAFGICKGFYDANIFAAIYDVVPSNVRASAAGLMNTVGWGGGALGPLFVGFASKYGGRATQVENMSLAIAWCGLIYLLSAGFLLGAVYIIRARTGTATTSRSGENRLGL